MQEKYPTVSIISINYNQLEVTCQLLDSIRQLNCQPHEVILIDNASQSNPEAYIRRHYPEVLFLHSNTNLGFSGGNNLGIKMATGDYFFLVNSDAEIPEGCITTMLQLFESLPHLGIASPLICYHPDQHDHDTDLIQYAGTTPVHPFTARNRTIGAQELDIGQYTQPTPTAYTHGAAMMIPRHVVEKVGMMPEPFFLYYEELDWCEQIRRAGFDVYVEPRARIYHKESASIGAMSPLKTYYLNRNRIFFMRRNKRWYHLLVFTIFLLFLTIPKNSIRYLLKGQLTQLKAFWKAIGWNLLLKRGNEQPDTNRVNTALSQPSS